MPLTLIIADLPDLFTSSSSRKTNVAPPPIIVTPYFSPLECYSSLFFSSSVKIGEI